MSLLSKYLIYHFSNPFYIEKFLKELSILKIEYFMKKNILQIQNFKIEINFSFLVITSYYIF